MRPRAVRSSALEASPSQLMTPCGLPKGSEGTGRRDHHKKKRPRVGAVSCLANNNARSAMVVMALLVPTVVVAAIMVPFDDDHFLMATIVASVRGRAACKRNTQRDDSDCDESKNDLLHDNSLWSDLTQMNSCPSPTVPASTV